ncbi:MAG: hypothetical protein Ct9H90mV1_0160 [Prasinovirus sp.]|nr:MAG: hypothetical protein Ct9H90mV1_0160 [Prasinovirus sp.]
MVQKYGVLTQRMYTINNNTLSDAVLPVVPETKGGTGQNAYAQGDILFQIIQFIKQTR